MRLLIEHALSHLPFKVSTTVGTTVVRRLWWKMNFKKGGWFVVLRRKGFPGTLLDILCSPSGWSHISFFLARLLRTFEKLLVLEKCVVHATQKCTYEVILANGGARSSEVSSSSFSSRILISSSHYFVFVVNIFNYLSFLFSSLAFWFEWLRYASSSWHHHHSSSSSSSSPPLVIIIIIIITITRHHHSSSSSPSLVIIVVIVIIIIIIINIAINIVVTIITIRHHHHHHHRSGTRLAGCSYMLHISNKQMIIIDYLLYLFLHFCTHATGSHSRNPSRHNLRGKEICWKKGKRPL